MSDLLTDLDLKTERATEPPRKWRNWWRAIYPADGECELCGDVVTLFPGQVFRSHCHVHPSKDVAESHAAESLRVDIEAFGVICDEWLGAYPEGERPE